MLIISRQQDHNCGYQSGEMNIIVAIAHYEMHQVINKLAIF